MAYDHDLMAHGAAKVLLSQIRNGMAGAWATPRLTPATTYWHGLSDWPRPDHAFQDLATGSSLAIEFKPPAQPKREYVTGLGQVLTYLRDFEYALIVLPIESIDGFRIAEYVKDGLTQACAQHLSLGVFAYDRNPSDPADLRHLLPLRLRAGAAPPIPKGINRKVFWAYWRDLSQYEVFALLAYMDAKGQSFGPAFRRFWRRERVTGKARTWDGARRRAKPLLSPSYRGESANALLSLRHTGLVSSDRTLTDAGYGLLHLGKIYGPESVIFKSTLARHVLQEGRHLDLILWVAEQQRAIPRGKKRNAARFYHELDLRLEKAGIIPAAPTGRSKPTFLRDEQKLWNKLGLLIARDNRSYFHPGEGLVFNWEAVIAVLG